MRLPLTPELLGKATELLAKSRAMADTPSRYDYEIGDYWNICGEMDEFLEELLNCKSMAAGHNNPLYDTEVTI